MYPLHTAITKVNELLKPHIELEFNSTRFNLVPLDWKVIEPLMNKVLVVYNKGVELGTLTMECDDVPTGVSISNMSDPILLALKDYLNELHEPVDKFIKLADLANKSISLKNIEVYLAPFF